MGSELYRIKDKCFEDGEEFSVFKTSSYCLIQKKGHCGPELLEFMKEPGRFISKVDPVLKDSRTTFAGLIKLGGRNFFLKKYNNKGLRHSLRYLFRLPRPLKAFRNSWLFTCCGVPVPETFAASCSWKAGLLDDGYIVCEFFTDSVPTLDFHKVLHNDDKLKNRFAETVMDYLAKLHENGLTHGDLKMSNIFVRKKENGDYSFGFWDLDAARIGNGAVCTKERVMELARVISSFIEIAGRLEIKADMTGSTELFTGPYCAKSGIEIPQDLLAEKIGEFFDGK